MPNQSKRNHRVCEWCGKEFPVWPKIAIRDNRRHCSTGCRTNNLYGPFPDRFWAKIDRSVGPDSCWLWTGKTDHGYGAALAEDGRLVRAHRLAWVLLVGPIPEGLEVCHDCPGGDNPTCVNPAHLFIGTHQENMQDASRKGRMVNQYARRTHCSHGHEYTSENTHTDRFGHRHCRVCRRKSGRRFRESTRSVSG